MNNPQKLTILVVDDSASARRLLARLLRAEGFETLCVEDGNRALEMLKFARADLIILDLGMPVMDGLEFLKILRQHPTWADLPVIVVTGRPEEHESLDQVWKLGVKECFVKATYTLSQLFTSIRRHAAA